LYLFGYTVPFQYKFKIKTSYKHKGGEFKFDIKQSLSNGEVAFLDMPSYSGKRNPKSFNPGTTYAINNNSEMKAEAWEFIKLLLMKYKVMTKCINFL